MESWIHSEEWNNYLKQDAQDAISKVKSIISITKNNDLYNEQWFLDFLDELNKLSVEW